MEIEGSDGSKFLLKPDSTTEFGRKNGFLSNDLTVSRRQISFDFHPSPDTQTAPRVSFEVLGKNPIWVYNEKKKDGVIKAYKRFQRGELGYDDLFCVSLKTPIWFALKKVDEQRNSKCEEFQGRINNDLSEVLETASGFEDIQDSVDVSNIDPVKEFGFLVIGHEFDHYPKQMIRDIKKWEWFLDDPKGDTDDEEDSEKKRTISGRRKRKKTNKGDDDDEDEEWTAESEGEELATNARKVQRPKYVTRLKDHGVHQKGTTNRKSSAKTSTREEEEEESEDEEDETLGGFIVTDDDDTVEEDEKYKLNEDEEEEFIEDDDEDELEE